MKVREIDKLLSIICSRGEYNLEYGAIEDEDNILLLASYGILGNSINGIMYLTDFGKKVCKRGG